MFAAWEEYHLINRGLDGLVDDLPHSNLGKVLSYVLSSQGKRVRPLILIFSSQAFGGRAQQALDAALAVELVHAASLVHDDILDCGLQRRGTASALGRFGPEASLLSGDFLISRSIDLISSYGQPVIKAFAAACMRMADGEMLDISPSVSPEDYFRCISEKTASLFAASAQIGCLISGAPKEDVTRLQGFGLHLGLAYQILDDLEEHMGLDQGKASGKVSATLPRIYAQKYSEEEVLALCIESIGDHSTKAREALMDSGADREMKDRLMAILDTMVQGGLQGCRLLKSLC